MLLYNRIVPALLSPTPKLNALIQQNSSCTFVLNSKVKCSYSQPAEGRLRPKIIDRGRSVYFPALLTSNQHFWSQLLYSGYFQHICSQISTFGHSYSTVDISCTFVLKSALLVTTTIQWVFPAYLFSNQHFCSQQQYSEYIFCQTLKKSIDTIFM